MRDIDNESIRSPHKSIDIRFEGLYRRTHACSLCQSMGSGYEIYVVVTPDSGLSEPIYICPWCSDHFDLLTAVNLLEKGGLKGMFFKTNEGGGADK